MYIVIHVFRSRYLNEFLDEFNRVLSTKFIYAKENADDNETKLNDLSRELEKLEETRKEVKKNSEYLKSTYFFFSKCFFFQGFFRLTLSRIPLLLNDHDSVVFFTEKFTFKTIYLHVQELSNFVLNLGNILFLFI